MRILESYIETDSIVAQYPEIYFFLPDVAPRGLKIDLTQLHDFYAHINTTPLITLYILWRFVRRM